VSINPIHSAYCILIEARWPHPATHLYTLTPSLSSGSVLPSATLVALTLTLVIVPLPTEHRIVNILGFLPRPVETQHHHGNRYQRDQSKDGKQGEQMVTASTCSRYCQQQDSPNDATNLRLRGKNKLPAVIVLDEEEQNSRLLTLPLEILLLIPEQVIVLLLFETFGTDSNRCRETASTASRACRGTGRVPRRRPGRPCGCHIESRRRGPHKRNDEYGRFPPVCGLGLRSKRLPQAPDPSTWGLHDRRGKFLEPSPPLSPPASCRCPAGVLLSCHDFGSFGFDKFKG
jgi:hypothetical protein